MSSLKNKKSQTTITALWVLLFAGCQGGLPVTKEITGRVTKVHDGDSVHISPAGEKRIIVRLAAIDAPEIKQSQGLESRNYLRSLILNREVLAQCNKLDKYRRNICVIKHNDRDINLEMLRAGHAWYYTKYKDEQTRTNRRAYNKAESQARRSKIGLWDNAEVQPPWEYRAQSN